MATEKWFSPSGTGIGFQDFEETFCTADKEVFFPFANWRILMEYVDSYSPEDWEIIFNGTNATDHNDENEVRLSLEEKQELVAALHRLVAKLKVERDRIHRYTSKRKEKPRYGNPIYANLCHHIIRVVEWSIEKQLPFETWAE